MIPFILNEKKIEVPSSWNELTVKQFFDVRNAKTFYEKMEAMTGEKDWDKIENMDMLLLPFTIWLTSNADFETAQQNNNITIQGQYKPIYYELNKDLGEYSFGQKIICQQKLSKLQEDKKDMVEALPLLIATYYQPICEDKKYSPEDAETFEKTIYETRICFAYPAFKFILAELLRLIERDSQYLSRPIKSEELMASSTELNKFKDFMLIDSLAGGDIFKHDAVTDFPYNRIFGKLYMENEKSKYQERLSEAMKRKHKV